MIDQCLDVRLGSGPSSQPLYDNQGVLQIYTCYPGSQQQNFHILNQDNGWTISWTLVGYPEYGRDSEHLGKVVKVRFFP